MGAPDPCTGTAAVPGLSCWKRCCSQRFLCSWPPLGPAGNTSYLLKFCYATPQLCHQFKVGPRTTYTFKHHHVYLLTNTTAWVEGHWGDHSSRTPNLTLYLDEAVRLDPPHTEMPFNKTSGGLWLQVPQPLCHCGVQLPQREARFRRRGDRDWTQVLCEAADEDDSVTCPLEGAGTFEVQLRHKLPHWSSYWSDWSSSIFVSEEILSRPELSYQLGKLRRDGQRVLRLGWQRVPEDQGNVTYTLQSRMLACGCAEEDTVELGTEVTEHNLTLSGAEYQILLAAANAAGPGPEQQLLVPADQRADLGFKAIQVAGSTVTAQWEAPSPGSGYCFEQQPLPGAPKEGVCSQRDFTAKSVHMERGTLDTPACYRLAVHGWNPTRGWATLAVTHHYVGNASLAVPVHINGSAGDATVGLWWSPSPRATCPGAMVKYLICHAAKGDNVTYDEVDSGVSHYTLRNLRPDTAYRVGVWEVTAESRGTCHPWWHFQTKALGGALGTEMPSPSHTHRQGAAWEPHLKYVGVPLALSTVVAVYQLSKKRAHRLLFPPVPKPMGSKAIQFSTGDTSQGQPWLGLLEPSERFSTAELLVQLNPSKETPVDPSTKPSTRPSTPQPSLVAEEPAVACPVVACPAELPFTYRRQELLSPVEFPPPGSSSGSSHPTGITRLVAKIINSG
ncbi:PREDICTED: interleukin-12 receptor subunit beta-1 [Chaetura pelagica]|uniref:interleukin-12 receptor subunit beta-1 n=1 Tax=Chaetura pelagica TaxID=8897 RepID=UPI00052346D3|nr:PREDICTED: interleukin-12 receptor subunit beta-1 [Chaetura pelagica]